ncbi:MAG: DUF3048 domain-containing protein [Bacillota bacterium]|uniref:DUF3048 domain-containing protein n=1 Tax=Bacillus sp. RO2 TaxID=2723913 RepID=UPI00145C7D77|nr:DUF3048 domain-containing protein [Bacillus sp. RO2]MEA3318478.1 DUF3048 domain-containing protein [Bacillota bacterium]NMH71551.1 DUF3048 domain-containing protein [Bacillus sp. RO2]
MSRNKTLLLACLMLMLAGCQSNDEKNVETSQEQSEETTEVAIEEEEQVATEVSELTEQAPLTGEMMAEKIDARPVAVMVNNDIKARPQSGLHKADVVYEVLAEGDITRLLAIFHSEMPETVGPVRSSRAYFVDLAKAYDALYVFHGWSPGAKEKIQAGEVDGINGLTYDGTLFKRASFRKAPHNSYISSANIQKGAKQLNYETQAEVAPFTFLKKGQINPHEATALEQVKIEYSSRQATHIEYRYDAEKKAYVRYSGGVKHTDLETKEEIIAHNVLLVEAAHLVVDKQGRREIDITSGGNGVLIQNGERFDVEWKSVDGKILPYKNGEQVPLVPGKTWIQIIPDLNKVTY